MEYIGNEVGSLCISIHNGRTPNFWAADFRISVNIKKCKTTFIATARIDVGS